MTDTEKRRLSTDWYRLSRKKDKAGDAGERRLAESYENQMARIEEKLRTDDVDPTEWADRHSVDSEPMQPAPIPEPPANLVHLIWDKATGHIRTLNKFATFEQADKFIGSAFANPPDNTVYDLAVALKVPSETERVATIKQPEMV